MSEGPVLYSVEDNIATITLHRPDAHNAMSFEAIDAMIAALDRADADDDVRAVIITGSGERAFCSGTDLRGRTFNTRGGDPATGADLQLDEGGQISLRLFDMNKFVIGAINGAAAGIGVSISLAMDVRVASANARFAFVYNRRGIVLESCCSWFLPRIVGIAKAVEWASTGRMVKAEEALASGLVSEVVAPDALLARAREIARESIDNCAPLSVAISRRLLWRSLSSAGPWEATNLESRALRGLIEHADMKEGVASFMEKRPPVFTGKPSSDIGFVDQWWANARTLSRQVPPRTQG